MIVNEELKIRDTTYKLTGIIVQEGNANFGHYYSIIQNDNKWYLCNDSNVSEVKDINSITKKGYVYLFNKQK